MRVRVWDINEKLPCTCSHRWSEHRARAISNPEYNTYPLSIGGRIAYECEYKNVPKTYFPDPKAKPFCTCEGFNPRPLSVRNLIKVWVKKQEESRNHGR